MMSELEPVCTTIQLLTFLCTCITVAMSTIGDKILDTALSKVEIHLHVKCVIIMLGFVVSVKRNAFELLCAAQLVQIHYNLSNVFFFRLAKRASSPKSWKMPLREMSKFDQKLGTLLGR